MHPFRTRIQKDIVCEFMPPAKRPRGNASREEKAIIVCGGLPGYPGRREELMAFLSKKGYWTFIPRFRGTWESGGSFLRISPHQDVLDVAAQLKKGFIDLRSGKTHRLSDPSIFVLGVSFGGAAAILASRDPLIKKAAALSPVTDWRVETRAEPLAAMKAFTRAAFGNAYRGTEKDWKKLGTGAFYDPMHDAASIDGKKLILFHAKDDPIVPAKASSAFARRTGALLVLFPHGGHFSTSNVMDRKIWEEIRRTFR